MSIDSTGRVVASSPNDAKALTKENIQVDSYGNILKAQEEVIVKKSNTKENSSEQVTPADITGDTRKTSSKLHQSTTESNKNVSVSLNTTAKTPLNPNSTLNAEECKNVSLGNQYNHIHTNLSAPHCPTNVEYDEDLYCNETEKEYEDTNIMRQDPIYNTTGTHYVNLTTCIVLSISEAENATEHATVVEEEVTTEPINLYENDTLTNGSMSTIPTSILHANASGNEICSKLVSR